MSFTRFAELGRVCLINYGPEQGKLCTIVDILDHNRALIDGPVSMTGVSRQTINFKRLSLTDLKVKVGRNARHKALKKAFEKSDILGKWAASSWAKRIVAQKEKANLTDFQRFKVFLAKKSK